VDLAGDLSQYAPGGGNTGIPFQSPRGGFNRGEYEYIQRRLAQRAMFEAIQREAFPHRKAWELEEDWNLYNQTQDPALRNEEPQYARMLGRDGHPAAYLTERGQSVVARVHPRWSDIVVVDVRAVISRITPELFHRWFPGVGATPPHYMNVALASKERLGECGTILICRKERVVALAVALFGKSLFFGPCNHCKQHPPVHRNRIFLECRRRVEAREQGACNECLWSGKTSKDCHFGKLSFCIPVC